MEENSQERLVRELERDLQKNEGQGLEFIEKFPDDTIDLAKEIASFATVNAGTIYIGVDNDGNVVGVPSIASLADIKCKDELLNRIQGISQSIDPPVRVKVSFIERGGRIVVRIDVPKGAEPVYYVTGRPYVRDVTASRLARPNEVKEFYLGYFQRTPPVKRVDEIQSYISALLSLTSDIELTLISYEDSLINPDRDQMLYDIGVLSNAILEMSKVKPAEQLGIEMELVNLTRCLADLASYRSYGGRRSVDEFGAKAKTCLKMLTELTDRLKADIKIGSMKDYLGRLNSNLTSLRKDWERRNTYFDLGRVEVLREAFREHAFGFYRLAAYPEAKELGITDELFKLGRDLRELSSTERYFAFWYRESRLQKIEQKFSECETVISEIMKKVAQEIL